MSNWHPIETAPKNGQAIEVCLMEGGSPEHQASMKWDAAGTSIFAPDVVGLWVSSCGQFTWTDYQGCGPTHWRGLQ